MFIMQCIDKPFLPFYGFEICHSLPFFFYIFQVLRDEFQTFNPYFKIVISDLIIFF